ncbi:response regulator [Massilia sp. CFBP9012]|uniref:response regulator n=1 Tax=Massilia sp. CFBP9012 TaxID=3096531 RepID=UPI002A6B6757|nr:response regulator [Massilia sp. CFBP9012]MDY0975967.1 response regulator [Massilia sp. CFBP9012]
MAKTVMIVDDSISIRQVVGLTLRGAGYDVVEGSNGKDALAKLGKQKVHLVVSDVNMPEMNGIEFVKAVKAQPEYRFLPIIMLTTESGDEKKREGQAAGARAWVVKPFKPEVLLNAVQKLILP